MTEEDANLWQEEQLTFVRKAREETHRFVTEQHVLIAEAQRKARIQQQIFSFDSPSRYSLSVVASAFLSVVIAAIVGSVVGLALCRAIAAL